MKDDIEELALAYKENPTPQGLETLMKTMEPLLKYWCHSQCYLPWEWEDMQQVARIALVGALERFDPSRGIRFKTFAYRTVSGKLLNYYRDETWRVVIPRKYRELSTCITRAEGEYYKKYGDEPDVDQLSKLLNLDRQEVHAAMEAKQASQTTSLSEQLNDGEAGIPELYLGVADKNLDHVEWRKDLQAAINTLEEKQKKVIYYRYYEELTQARTAELMGVSQMQISRLEKQALEKIRKRITM